MITVKAESLLPIVQADLGYTQTLLQLLQEERRLLEQRQHEALPELIGQKDQLLQKLHDNEQRRKNFLQQLGMGDARNAWKEVVEGTGDNNLIRLWQQLQQALSECRVCNEINGRMIGRGQQSLGRIVSLLRGQINTPQLYNNKGATQGGGLGNKIISA